jgi:hypothetical protein
MKIISFSKNQANSCLRLSPEEITEIGEIDFQCMKKHIEIINSIWKGKFCAYSISWYYIRIIRHILYLAYQHK